MRVRSGHAVFPAGQRGSVGLGMMLGIVIGLAVAVAVAVFVTRAPLPFVNKVVRSGDRLVEPRTPAEAPDPNRPAAARARPSTDAPAARAAGEAAGAAASAPSAAAASPAPSGAAAGGPSGASPGTASGASSGASAGASSGASSGEAPEPAAERVLYVLQAGAFRLADDADNMKAKLALIGLEARVQPAEVNGQRVFRVRIGPYVHLDDLNRARARLEENGIESSVVRQR